MPYNRAIVGHVIGMLREQKGFTQEVLSGLAGISRSHLTLIENGRKTLRLSTLWQIADALQVAPSAIIAMAEGLGITPPPPPPPPAASPAAS